MANSFDILTLATDDARRQFKAAGSMDLLPEPVRIVLVVDASHGVLMNGGLRYFFESDWPQNPPYEMFVRAYQEIGAPITAKAIRESTILFPFLDPHLDQKRRDAFLETRFDGSRPRGEDFGRLDRAVFADKQQVDSALRRYIEQHASQFDLTAKTTGCPQESQDVDEAKSISKWDRFWYHPIVWLICASYFAYNTWRSGVTVSRSVFLGLAICGLGVSLYDYFSNHRFLRAIGRAGS